MTAEALSLIYHNPIDDSYLDGVERLQRSARQLHVPGAMRQTVQKYLRSEQIYTLHRPARRRSTRNHTYVAGIDAQWQADLDDMQGIARQNGGMRYLITVIDVYTMFAWAVQVHFNNAQAITAAFDQVLTAAQPRHPLRLQTDNGKEFFNLNFAGLMKRYCI